MHYIQLKILDQLLFNEVVRYSRLRPEGIESNHFSYHLNELQRDQLVTKVSGGYTLAPKGLAYVDQLSHKHMKPRPQPKIVTSVAISNEKSEVLFFQRNYQPYIKRLGWPTGKLHLDETVSQAAIRELQEKTGLTGVKLSHRGLVNIEVKRDNYVISHIMAHIFTGKVKSNRELGKTERGQCQWVKMSDVNDEHLMPGVRKLQELLRNKKFFFDELQLSD